MRAGKYETTRYWYAGLAISGAVHFLALTVVLLLPLLAWSFPFSKPKGSVSQQIVLVASTPDHRALNDESTDRQSPEAPAQIVSRSEPEPTGVPLSDYVRQQIQSAVKKTDEVSDAENLEQLGKLSHRLKGVASEESLRQLSAQLNRWMGTEERATQQVPDNSAEEFDYRSAQLHDVTRTANDSGEYSYISVLMDAQGRTVSVPMNAEDGSRMYRIFELVKANPLLEQVYRQFVMGLLDQWIRQAESE